MFSFSDLSFTSDEEMGEFALSLQLVARVNENNGQMMLFAISKL